MNEKAPPFDFATATEVLYGRGRIAELGDRLRGLGSRALVVTGSVSERAGPAVAALEAAGLGVTRFTVPSEPSTELARRGVHIAREAHCDAVVGVGGGSVVDAGKAIAMLLSNGGDPLDYLEVVGKGQPIRRPSAPFVAVPTTAGTGSEVTRNAVLESTEHRIKASLRSVHMLPRLALVDPALTDTVPPDVTAATGLDALTQVIEPFVSNRPNPMTDALCLDGIARSARSLRRAYRDGRDTAARDDLALTSLFGGIALANSKLGAVHGFAGPLGGMFHAPHGAICARLLPAVVRANLRALRERTPSSPVLARYDHVARILTNRAGARADDGAEWLEELVRELAIPALSAYGIGNAHFDTIADKARAASSMKGNPIELRRDELVEILTASL